MGSVDVEMVSFGIGVGDNHRMPYPLEFLSSFLASGVSKILGFRVGGMVFPSPINPVFGFFVGGLGGSFLGGSVKVPSPKILWSDSTAAIADWMSARVPPASSSLAFRFSRFACDLEYGFPVDTTCPRYSLNRPASGRGLARSTGSYVRGKSQPIIYLLEVHDGRTAQNLNFRLRVTIHPICSTAVSSE